MTFCARNNVSWTIDLRGNNRSHWKFGVNISATLEEQLCVLFLRIFKKGPHCSCSKVVDNYSWFNGFNDFKQLYGRHLNDVNHKWWCHQTGCSNMKAVCMITVVLPAGSSWGDNGRWVNENIDILVLPGDKLVLKPYISSWKTGMSCFVLF